jgi:hypothetical protein
VIQFRSQCQKLCFTGDLRGYFGLRAMRVRVMPNAKAHHVVASKLLAGQAIPSCFIHLPGPGQILVGDPFLAEVAIGLASGQHIPDQFQQLTRHATIAWLRCMRFCSSWNLRVQRGSDFTARCATSTIAQRSSLRPSLVMPFLHHLVPLWSSPGVSPE